MGRSIPAEAVATRRDLALTGAAILLMAFATRLQIFGNPILYADEQLYLLIGDRMLHGAIPYVDMWDRKPVGLFVLYAAMRSLGGDGVLAYQIVGTFFAAATALVIVRIAREFAGGVGALTAGLAYLAWLNVATAGGGQSPLFYNLLMALAAYAVMRALQRGRRIFTLGCAAMLLCGLAMQVKYSAVFEGMFFGLCLIFATFRSGSRGLIPVYAGIWAAIALLPTLAAVVTYAALGQLDAFLFANFYSVFERNSEGSVVIENLAVVALIVAPLVACALAATHSPADEDGRTAHRFVLGWLAAAIVGLLVFGTYTAHYALPLLVPAATGAAAWFGRGPKQRRIAIALIFFAALTGQVVVAMSARGHGTRAQFDRVVGAIDVHRGCLFVHVPYAALYRVTNACTPTRYVFPSHLYKLREQGAIGVDQAQEVARIMASRPETVVTGPASRGFNLAAEAILKNGLDRDYVEVLQTQLGSYDVEVFHLRTDR